MKTKNWQEVNEIVLTALDMTTKRRRKFIERKCAESPDLRGEIESLLANESEAEKFFDVPAVSNYASFFGDANAGAENLAGQEIGSYRIIRELEQGGMGAVYLAERADGKFSQQVAIKLLKRELNTGDFRRTFNREKEILASLSHPNIARLLDTGTIADGIPYLVMEYVEGIPLDRFCHEKELSLNARLKLFNRVCEAVAYAHRNLIIHRDLKPSNILVTEDGTPKLLDFGISKLIDAQSKNDQTATGLSALTPHYASPEQIRGETVSTATDIYSLGVVLYKILTENFPYDFQNDSKSLIFRAITEHEPSLPSRKLPINEKQTLKLISPSHLKGDLDNIILKSLAKEPERRYKTVEAFSADIWRFIDGMPVMARRATFSYRARKFYRRNQIPVLAGVLIFLSLVGGLVAAVSQARAAREQASIAYEARLVAERESRNAKAEQEKAEKISRFVGKIISYANPAWYGEGWRFGGQAKVIDAIDDLEGKIDDEFAGQADVQSELHHKFGEVYGWISGKQTDAAHKEYFEKKSTFHILRAYELRKQFYGEWHELIAKDLYYAHYHLAENERGRAELMAKAIVMMRETNPQNINFPYMLDHYATRLVLPDTAENHENYLNAAIPATGENKYALGERYLREALPVFRIHYKPDNSAIFKSECKLAYALAMQDKWSDFDEHYAVCKSGEEAKNLPETVGKDKYIIDYIEKILTENKK